MGQNEKRGFTINTALVGILITLLGFGLTWLYGPLSKKAEENEETGSENKQDIAVLKERVNRNAEDIKLIMKRQY